MKLRLGLVLLFSGLVMLTEVVKEHGRRATPRAQSAPGSGAATAPRGRTPVLVELFTSEGCSSCPPADALLAQLGRSQPVPGALVITLEHHVDYWDRLGWRDPFSSAEATFRQEAYAQSFGNEGPYTPQMVVDGASEFIGSDERAARRAIDRASKTAKAALELEWISDNATRTLLREPLQVRIGKLTDAPGDSAEVFLAITEDNLHSDVARGENAGRALDHASVVRRFERLGKADPAKAPAFAARRVLKLDPAWKRANLHAVVFVQQTKSRRVLAAASLALPAS